MDVMEINDNTNINKKLTSQGLRQEDFQVRKSPSKCVTVCLGLLCVVLLAANVGQFMYNRKQLEAGRSNLTDDLDQLQERCKIRLHESAQAKIDRLKGKVRARLCQSGWQKFDVGCYIVSTEKRNWTAGRQDCIAKGADLAIINSMDEQAFVNSLLKSGQNAWIGMTDRYEEGTWMWVDGTPVITTYWQDGQPNSYSGDQDCGEMVEKSPGEGEWNDDGCSADQLFICEQ